MHVYICVYENFYFQKRMNPSMLSAKWAIWSWMTWSDIIIFRENCLNFGGFALKKFHNGSSFPPYQAQVHAAHWDQLKAENEHRAPFEWQGITTSPSHLQYSALAMHLCGDAGDRKWFPSAALLLLSQHLLHLLDTKSPSPFGISSPLCHVSPLAGGQAGIWYTHMCQ